MLALCCFVILLIGFPFGAPSSRSDGELLALWYRTLVDPGTLKWDIQADLCGQEGVFCNSDGYLISLELSGYSIHGAIPSIFGEFRYLKSFQLDHNHLLGVIPIELANINSLEILTLDNNTLIGAIPGQLKARSLTKLFLGHNCFRMTPNYSTWAAETDYSRKLTWGHHCDRALILPPRAIAIGPDAPNDEPPVTFAPSTRPVLAWLDRYIPNNWRGFLISFGKTFAIVLGSAIILVSFFSMLAKAFGCQKKTMAEKLVDNPEKVLIM